LPSWTVTHSAPGALGTGTVSVSYISGKNIGLLEGGEVPAAGHVGFSTTPRPGGGPSPRVTIGDRW
jgi:hypothetical protein